MLNYLNSGDTAGDRTRVVGYAAIAFFGDPPMPAMQEANQLLAPEKGQVLVKLARSTLMEKFGRPLPPSEADRMRSALSDASFQARCGTFVTLKHKGQLRGCIGSLSASDPLAEGVRRNAVNAAFHDPRFSPLTESELGQVEIEVSVLTEPQPLAFSDPEDLLRKLRAERRRGDHPPRARQRDLSAPGLGAASEKRGFFRPPLPQSRAAPGRLETRPNSRYRPTRSNTLKSTREQRTIAVVIATGIASVVTQLVLIREFLSQFQGNEIVIALILFSWLVLGGLGTLLSRPAAGSRLATLQALYWLSLALVLFSILTLFGARLLRDLVFTRGASVGFYQTFVYIAVGHSALCPAHRVPASIESFCAEVACARIIPEPWFTSGTTSATSAAAPCFPSSSFSG